MGSCGSFPLRHPAVEVRDFGAEVGAEVSREVIAIPVVGDAVEDVAVDRPAAAGGATGDFAVDREVERAGRDEGLGVVAEVGRLRAEPLGFAVERSLDRVAVDVEDLVGLLVPGDPGAADRRAQQLPVFVAPDDGGADVEVLATAEDPLRVASIRCAGKTPNGRCP